MASGASWSGCRICLLLIVALDCVASGTQCGEADAPACPSCPASHIRRCGNQRVRRNFLSLSYAERKSLFAAMDAIKTTSWTDGLQRFGPKFKPYDYFVQRHAQAQTSPLSDRAHGGPWFHPYHRLLVLEYEEVLLTVDSSIKALPYWDITHGHDGVLGPDELEFGSVVGTGDDFRVTDGYFGHWTVGHFNESLANASGNDGYYTGNDKGEIRSASNNPRTDGITRYPNCSGSSVTNADFDRCANLVGTIDDYHRCVSERRTAFHGSLHSEAHVWLGSRMPPEDSSCQVSSEKLPRGNTEVMLGDMFDVATSVNDPIWMLHHANIDRNAFHFTLRNHDKASVYYGYRATPGNDMWFDLYEPTVEKGLLLLDVVTSRQPFLGSDLGLSEIGGPSGPLTVADSLCWIGATTGLYTYDSVVNVACGDMLMHEM